MKLMENQDIREVHGMKRAMNLSQVELDVVRFTMEFLVYRMMDQ